MPMWPHSKLGLKASEVVIAGKLCILQNVDYRVLLLNAPPMIP